MYNNNDIILITPFKYSETGFFHLANTIINIINLDVNFDSWYILIGDSKNLSKEAKLKINNLFELILHYDYDINILFFEEKHPAHLKYNIFNYMINEYGNSYSAYFVSIDADRIFRKYCFTNLIYSLKITHNKDFIIYPVVDYLNYRGYKDYIFSTVNKNNINKIIEKYGKKVLPYCKVQFNKYANFIEIPIGGSGFAVHSTSLDNNRLNLLKNFEDRKRGHDVVLADTYDKKYLLTDSWCIHLGADKYDEYWKGYDERVNIIYKKLEGEIK